VEERGSWTVAAGSLLTGSREMASTSWRRWRELQPRPRAPRERQGFDPGPNFYADPFPGIRILRQVVSPGHWASVATSIQEGSIPTSFGPCTLNSSGDWSSVAIIGRDEAVDRDRLVTGAMRPVSAVFVELEAPNREHLDP
jgi:hypothetical protein